MTNWNLKKLLIPPAIMLTVLLSWLSPLFRPYWDALDAKTFSLLNPWVQTNPFWQHFWAFASTRTMDWIHDGIMFCFFFIGVRKAVLAHRRKKIAECIFAVLCIALTICLVNGILFPEFIHLPRKSPTMIDKTAFRLSSVIDWAGVKDHSRKSFPGDHATMAVLFVSFIYHLMGWRLGLMATLYGIFFCLPRLILGAHWLTDVAIGSAFIGITMSSLFMGSPLYYYIVSGIEWLIKKPLARRQGLIDKTD